MAGAPRFNPSGGETYPFSLIAKAKVSWILGMLDKVRVELPDPPLTWATPLYAASLPTGTNPAPLLTSQSKVESGLLVFETVNLAPAWTPQISNGSVASQQFA